MNTRLSARFQITGRSELCFSVRDATRSPACARAAPARPRGSGAGCRGADPERLCPGGAGLERGGDGKRCYGHRRGFKTIPRYCIRIYKAINLNAESNLGYIWYHRREIRLYSNSLSLCPDSCPSRRLRGAMRPSGSSPVLRNELAEQQIAIGCEARPGSERPARAAAPPFAVAVCALGSSGRGVPGSASGAQVPERGRARCPPRRRAPGAARSGGAESNSFCPLLPPRRCALPSLLIIAGQLLICM